MSVKKVFKNLAIILLMTLCGIVLWSFVPNAKAPFPADPGVSYANEIGNPQHPYKEAYFTHAGQNLHYVEAGEGSLVVLIHGFPSHWYAMQRQMEALKSNYRVVAIDALGAGLSDAPFEKDIYQLKNQTTQLNALLNHLSKDEAVILIGHDWGGAFAFAFAQNFPERVHKLVGISSPPPNVLLNLIETNPEQREKSAYVEKMQTANAALLVALQVPKKVCQGAYTPLLDSQKISQEEQELFCEASSKPKRINAYLNWYRANIPKFDEINSSSYWPAKDAKLTMPVLVIRGKDDPVFVPEYVDEVKKISSSIQVLELENTGHWPHVEEAERVNKEIISFIKN